MPNCDSKSFQKTPLPPAGRSRVVIDAVRPAVDGGRFPIKRIVGEKVTVQADVFADGHDKIGVALLHRKQGERKWCEKPMQFRGNDLWEAEFPITELGFYEYAVTGWIDHFLSWHDGLKKKVDNGVEVKVDLLIGAELLEKAAARARGGGKDRKKLSKWSAELHQAEEIGETKELVELAMSDELRDLGASYPDRSLATTSEAVFPVLVEREKAQFSTWYEFFPRSWSKAPGKHGTFKDCERILPEIKKLGFDVVYLPPVHPIGKTKRKGKNDSLTAEPDDVGSPWAIGSSEGGHKSVHPELGTLEDFKHFVAAAEKQGLEVALDIAFQCTPDHPYVKEHPQWFNWRPDGTVQFAENPPKKYEDILPLNFETEDWQNLWLELKSIFTFWIEQGVTIFRVDNPHTKSMAFWDWLTPELKREHPEVLLLSESFTRPKLKYRFGKLGFTYGYTYFTWRNSKEDLTAYIEELTSSPVKECFRPNFWPNTPDILNQTLQYGGRPVFVQRLILAATLSSNYGIYGPAYELCVSEANPKKPEEYHHSEKYQLHHWNWDAPGNIKDIIARVNQIRRENAALQRTDNISFVETDNPAVIAYLKRTPDWSNIILVVVNLDPYHTQTCWLTFPKSKLKMDPTAPFLVHDLLTSGKYVWQGALNFIRLEPHSCPAHIFRVFREQRREQNFDYFM